MVEVAGSYFGPAGPYGTKSEALWASGADRPDSARRLNRVRLDETIFEAGVEVGSWDRRVLDWLADQEPAIVESIAAVIDRAREARS